MRYVPWDELDGRPNIVVDGYPATGTVLTLSHWRGSGTPEELADDLSTQIAFRYLDRPDLAVTADAVTNNHFDEDGLCGIYAVLHPEEALARRDELIDVASAGDFDVFSSREMARVAFALGTFADENRSPLNVFDRPYPQTSAALYEELLERLPEMVDHPDRFEDLWKEEDAWLARDEELVRSRAIKIKQRRRLDLAIVTLPDTIEDRDAEESILGCHASAIYNRTARNRILAMRGRRYVVRYRYETWVRYVSATTAPRVDLTLLADELSTREPGRARWTFDGVDSLTPSLRLDGGEESAIDPGDFVAAVEDFLGRSA